MKNETPQLVCFASYIHHPVQQTMYSFIEELSFILSFKILYKNKIIKKFCDGSSLCQIPYYMQDSNKINMNRSCPLGIYDLVGKIRHKPIIEMP